MSQPPTGNPAFFGQKVSKPGVNVLNAGPSDLVYMNDYTTTTYYDSKNSRILLGQLPDGTYGVQVSTPGVNVTSATPGEYALNSSLPTLQSVWSTSGTQSVAAGSGGLTLGPYSTGTGQLTLPLVTCHFNPGQPSEDWGSYAGSVFAATGQIASQAPTILFSAIDTFTILFEEPPVSGINTYVYTINMMLLTNQTLT